MLHCPALYYSIMHTSGVNEEAGTRGLKERGDGEEGVREGSIGGRPERDREGKAREVKVPSRSSEL